MTLSLLIYLVLASFAVAYLTRWLLFDPYQSGLFESKNVQLKVIAENEEGKAIEFERSVDLTDRIRYVFRAYTIDKEEPNRWFTDQKRLKLWLCPYCLAFWISFLVTWYIFLNIESDIYDRLFLTAISHFACSMLAAKVVLYETG